VITGVGYHARLVDFLILFFIVYFIFKGVLDS
jgi:hypothetical protein